MDLIKLVNVLRDSGAEAISINGQRIVNMTEIRGVGEAGDNIIINGKRVVGPYTIKAIGNPDYLESGLTIKGGYADEMKAASIDITITKEKSVTVEKYSQDMDIKYIK